MPRLGPRFVSSLRSSRGDRESARVSPRSLSERSETKRASALRSLSERSETKRGCVFGPRFVSSLRSSLNDRESETKRAVAGGA